MFTSLLLAAAKLIAQSSVESSNASAISHRCRPVRRRAKRPSDSGRSTFISLVARVLCSVDLTGLQCHRGNGMSPGSRPSGSGVLAVFITIASRL